MTLFFKRENIQIHMCELKSDPKYFNHYVRLLLLPFPITAALVQILIVFAKLSYSYLYFKSFP